MTTRYSGYVMDMEISHSSRSPTMEAFVRFLDTFAGALAAKNMTLQVITRYDFPKSYIVRSTIESILSYDYTSEGGTLAYIEELTVKYPSKVGVMLAPAALWNATQFFGAVASQKPYSCKHLALWSDMSGLSASFLHEAANWLANRTA